MKLVGIILIGTGVALIAYVIFSLLTGSKKIVSPIPEDKGVKVIFVSPSATQ